MDLTFHKETLAECEQKENYFNKIAFPALAQSFGKAARSLSELIDIIEKSNNSTVAETEISEEGGNE